MPPLKNKGKPTNFSHSIPLRRTMTTKTTLHIRLLQQPFFKCSPGGASWRHTQHWLSSLFLTAASHLRGANNTFDTFPSK